MKFSEKIGIMQGRLSPQYLNLIQSFPEKHWRKEFRLAKKLKLKLIEWTLDYKNLLKNPIFVPKYINEINYLKKKYKIKILSLTADCLMQKPFWKLKNKRYLEMFFMIVNACSNLGIKYIVVPLVDNGSLTKKKYEEKLIKILKQKNNFFSKKKVQILFESDFGPQKLKNFINKLPKKNFGINYDVGNSASLGYDIEKEFKTYGNNIKNVHIKDRIYCGKTVRLGLGNANFKKLREVLIKNKYKNSIILQTARGKKNKDIEEIKINLNFLTKNKII